MNNRKLEFIVGCFVLCGIGAVLYLALQIGGARLFGGDYYQLTAQFNSAAGVSEGSRIEIAGVPVGVVQRVELNEDFYAEITLELPGWLELDDDTIASIKTSGLIGDRYIRLSPGGSGIPLEPGEQIFDTESALDIESLIGKFALGGIDEGEK